ncbi:hypothetical protein ABZ942_25845 [Nocardia sp. NPDC046473]
MLERIDPTLIGQYVDNLLRDIDRPTWPELAAEIGQFAKWEFHEYRP